MATSVIVRTALEFAQALIPHFEHDWYRCDKPHDRMMGKGCRTCDVEAYISIGDFRANGDLEVYEKEIKPFLKKKEK